MTAPIPGAQVVARIGKVLRAVTALAPHGGSTTQIAAATELARPTVHRLLVALLGEGYLDRDEDSGLWFLGPEVYVMGALAGTRFDVTEHARQAIRAIAAETEESAFFSVRRQDETVCLMREEGSFPIRSFVLHEGARFPLGVASAGLAILAHLDEDEAHRYLSRARLEKTWGEAHARSAVEARVAETRIRGYAVNPGLLVEGSWGMGAAVFNAAGQPQWALSITGIEARFRAGRQELLGRILLSRAHWLSRIMQGGTG